MNKGPKTKQSFQEQLERIREAFASHTFEKEVLLIDDNKSLAHLLQATLGGGFRSELCFTGREALQKIEERKFDLIIVDLHLPDISGVSIIQHVKKSQPLVPILVITGDATTSTLAQEALNAGASLILTKPLPCATEFRAILGKYLLLNEEKGA